MRLFPKAKYWCCLLAAGLTCLLTVRDLNLHVVWAVLRLLSFGHTLCTAILQCTWCASMVLIPKPDLQPAGEPAAAFARGCRSRPAGSSGGTPPSQPTATSRVF